MFYVNLSFHLNRNSIKAFNFMGKNGRDIFWREDVVTLVVVFVVKWFGAVFHSDFTSHVWPVPIINITSSSWEWAHNLCCLLLVYVFFFFIAFLHQPKYKNCCLHFGEFNDFRSSRSMWRRTQNWATQREVKRINEQWKKPHKILLLPR